MEGANDEKAVDNDNDEVACDELDTDRVSSVDESIICTENEHLSGQREHARPATERAPRG